MNGRERDQLRDAIEQLIGEETDYYSVQMVLVRLANKYEGLAYDASPAGKQHKKMLEIKDWVVATTGVGKDTIEVNGASPVLILYGIEYQRHFEYFRDHFAGKPEFVEVKYGEYQINSPLGKVEAEYREEPMYEGCVG